MGAAQGLSPYLCADGAGQLGPPAVPAVSLPPAGRGDEPLHGSAGAGVPPPKAPADVRAPLGRACQGPSAPRAEEGSGEPVAAGSSGDSAPLGSALLGTMPPGSLLLGSALLGTMPPGSPLLRSLGSGPCSAF
ncbi:MAG: hypothetical protein BGO26_20790 [Actinobacteria bacterium 69-20]|nr:MAG: hypothetical protein BGO26_20790 [Actinobacteria bacterium 69-20]